MREPNGSDEGPRTKRLVLCCDGTWNTPTDAGGPTNVWKLSQGVVNDYGDDGVLLHEPAGTPQMVKYQMGVGTARMQRIRGGAFGFGLSRNVRELYAFIVEHYEPGDELYFVGFSRGAYTARSTVGLIHNFGILRREHAERVAEVYRMYKSPGPANHPHSEEAKRYRTTYAHDPVDVCFVGVWDTVGALGIPIPGLWIPKIVKRHWGFHDATLNKYVRGAYQAVAIDERRGPFKPSLWKQEKSAPTKQEVEQVWFAGCHRDVGGGQAVPDLSEIPLLWMVDRARHCGLTFKPDHFQVCHEVPDAAADAKARQRGERLRPNALAPFRDSRTLPYKLMLPSVRALGAVDKHGQPRAEGEAAASSAQSRVTHATPPYDPRSLVLWLAAGRPVTVVTEAPAEREREPPRSGVPAVR